MKYIRLSFVVILVWGSACTEDEFVELSNNDSDEFLLSDQEGDSPINVTQDEARVLLTAGPARVLFVDKPKTAIRRWWKSFHLSLLSNGTFVFETMEGDVIPRKGTWEFAYDEGIDIVLFGKTGSVGNEVQLERFAKLKFTTSSAGNTRFEMAIKVDDSDLLSEALNGQWTFFFEL